MGADTTQIKIAIHNGAYETACKLATQAMADINKKL
jgi:hypothetical protein